MSECQANSGPGPHFSVRHRFWASSSYPPSVHSPALNPHSSVHSLACYPGFNRPLLQCQFTGLPDFVSSAPSSVDLAASNSLSSLYPTTSSPLQRLFVTLQLPSLTPPPLSIWLPQTPASTPPSVSNPSPSTPTLQRLSRRPEPPYPTLSSVNSGPGQLQRCPASIPASFNASSSNDSAYQCL